MLGPRLVGVDGHNRAEHHGRCSLDRAAIDSGAVEHGGVEREHEHEHDDGGGAAR